MYFDAKRQKDFSTTFLLIQFYNSIEFTTYFVLPLFANFQIFLKSFTKPIR